MTFARHFIYTSISRTQPSWSSLFIFFSVFHRNRNGPTTNCAPLPPATATFYPSITPPPPPPIYTLVRGRRQNILTNNHTPVDAPLSSASGPDLFSPSCTPSSSVSFPPRSLRLFLTRVLRLLLRLLHFYRHRCRATANLTTVQFVVLTTNPLCPPPNYLSLRRRGERCTCTLLLLSSK